LSTSRSTVRSTITNCQQPLVFEKVGAVKIKHKIVSGHEEKVPIVDYDEIKIDLKAA
jgi:hypothetical protein